MEPHGRPAVILTEGCSGAGKSENETRLSRRAAPARTSRPYGAHEPSMTPTDRRATPWGVRTALNFRLVLPTASANDPHAASQVILYRRSGIVDRQASGLCGSMGLAQLWMCLLWHFGQ